jgi:signal transduction histidine kinase
MQIGLIAIFILVGLVVYFFFLKDLSRKNETLDRLNRTKTEFLQDMSHEMKTPLTVIATGIDYADSIIRKENGDVDKARQALETIQGETQRLGRMMSGMVKLANMNLSGNRTRVDFAALLKSGAETFRMTHKSNTLHVQIAPDLPDVFVEHDSFSQVITNLLSNAANHTQNGEITLAADLCDGYMTVRVADTGEGIDPELLPQVFKRGVSGRGGTGYGLDICKTVVEAHGGDIDIESKPGKGTVVTFTVPVYGGQESVHKL